MKFTFMFQPHSDLGAANKSPLSVLSAGFGSPACFLWPAPCICFFLASFSPPPPPPLSSACVCDMENGVRRNHEGGKTQICVDPPAPPVSLLLLFVVPQPVWAFASHHSFLSSVFSPPPSSSAGAQNGLAFPGASGHKRRPRLLQSYQGTNGWGRVCRHYTH